MYGSDMDITRKLLPCSSHDIAKLEVWLEDMAKQGMRLYKIGNDIAKFEKRNPAAIRYCLFVKPKDYLYVDGKSRTESQLIAYMQELGWQYVTKYNHILYFATEHADVPKPERDAPGMIQLIAKKNRNSLIGSSLLLVMMTFYFSHLPLYWLVERGTGVAFLISIILAICMVQEVKQLQNLKRWRQIVAEGRLHSVEVDWRQGSNTYRTFLAGALLMSAIFFACMFAGIFVDLDDLNRVQLSEQQRNINVPTLEELYPQHRIENTQYSYVERDFDVLSPIVVKTDLFGDVYDDEQYLGIAKLNMIYFRTWHESIAKRLVMDYIKDWMIVNQTITLPDYGIDYAAAYQTKHGLHVILQNDNRLICIEYDLGDNRFPQTAEQIAELYISAVQFNEGE